MSTIYSVMKVWEDIPIAYWGLGVCWKICDSESSIVILRTVSWAVSLNFPMYLLSTHGLSSSTTGYCI